MQQIAKMESKLLSGNIIEQTNEQKLALEAKRKQIEEEEKKEREMKRKLLEEEQSALNLTETYNSYQQEAEAKTKKLKKLFLKLQSSKAEMKQIVENNASERHELEGALNDLIKELKLKTLIVDNFIPASQKSRLQEAMQWSEEQDDWVINEDTLMQPTNHISPLDHFHRPYDENILQVGCDVEGRWLFFE